MRKVLTTLSLAMLIGACGPKTDAGTTSTTTTNTTPKTTSTAITPVPTRSPALEVMAQWTAATDKADWAKLKSLYASNAVVAPAGMPKTFQGPDAIVAFFKNFRDGFPDLKSLTSYQLVNGNTVATIAMVKGTNTKPVAPGVAATNKQVSFLGLQISQVKDGKIVRQDLYADNFNFLAQLGVVKAGAFRPVWEGAEPTLVTAVSAANNATEKSNLTAVDTLMKHVNAHEGMAAIALYTPNAWLDDQSAPARVGGNGNILKEYKSLFAMFPDVALKDAKSWAAGDYVVTTYTFVGTNTGDTPGAKATNKTVTVPAASLFHLQNGKIATHWVFWDGAIFRAQLGILR